MGEPIRLSCIDKVACSSSILLPEWLFLPSLGSPPTPPSRYQTHHLDVINRAYLVAHILPMQSLWRGGGGFEPFGRLSQLEKHVRTELKAMIDHNQEEEGYPS